MAEKHPGPGDNAPSANSQTARPVPGREEKLARQLRDNLAKRKQQSRARNTSPRKFKNTAN